ncbi:MAG: alpha/beta hydrolase [Gammaproteobacteria bacterium]|jgi:acetyl esterase/lipase|nr:alpha/beta hydrolase [Gammaproteobacteria bacterium]
MTVELEMTSRHLVDPELLAALDTFPSLVFSAETLPLMRASLPQFLAMAPPSDVTDVTMVERSIPGPPGAPEVRVVVYRSDRTEGPMPVYLHMHGGGYVFGVPELNDSGNRRLASELRCAVVSVDYRLAPETPFPGPVEDCYAALVWLHAQAASLGVDPARIAIGGESAGAGLAASLGLLARDRGKAPVAFQMLIYPMLDDRTGTTSDPHPYTGEFIWTAESNHFGWASLLGGAPGGGDVSRYAAPARAENLAGLPPTFIAVGALDLFLEEDLDFARRLTRVGVPTELHVYPGAYHAPDMAPEARVAKALRRDVLEAMRRAFEESSQR